MRVLTRTLRPIRRMLATDPRNQFHLLLRHGLRPGRSRLDSPSFRRVSSFPPGLVILAPTSSFPRRRESPQAKSCFVHGLHGHSRTHLVIPAGSRHSHTHLVIPARAGISPSEELLVHGLHGHSRTHLVIPVPTTSFPRRRESPVALLDAPLGESPSPAVMPQKETVSSNLKSPRVPCPATHRTGASPAPRFDRQSQSCSIRPYPPPACARCWARNRGRIPGPDACS